MDTIRERNFLTEILNAFSIEIKLKDQYAAVSVIAVSCAFVLIAKYRYQ